MPSVCTIFLSFNRFAAAREGTRNLPSCIYPPKGKYESESASFAHYQQAILADALKENQLMFAINLQWVLNRFENNLCELNIGKSIENLNGGV